MFYILIHFHHIILLINHITKITYFIKRYIGDIMRSINSLKQNCSPLITQSSLSAICTDILEGYIMNYNKKIEYG